MNTGSSSTADGSPGAVRHGRAWTALSLALAVHVADEALNGFLSLYNPIVTAAREKLPFLPFPTFRFPVWLGGLIFAVVVLLFLSRFAFRGSRWMRPLSYFIGIVMLFNGLLHFVGSVYMDRPMPGVYSSPLLLACAIYLLWAVWKLKRENFL